MDLKKVLIDAAVALGLLAALGVVYGLDRAPVQPEGEPDVSVETIAEPLPEPVPLRLAVTPNQYDDMGQLLGKLGVGYQYEAISLEDLEEYPRIADFDVIFATCGTIPDAWAEAGNLGGGDRPGVVRVRVRDDVAERVGDALERWVREGGTLYASDWRLGLLSMAFEGLVNERSVDRGREQSLIAEVVDPGLADVIGRELPLRFDMRGWYPAGALSGRDQTVYLRGRYQAEGGGSSVAPLLVKIPYGEGTIIFTSFHNEKQNSEQELELLRYLVFAAVTARDVAKVNRELVKGGFSPRKQNLLSASPESPSVTKVYSHETSGNLRFVLSFSGARLRLDVRGPGGRGESRLGTSDLTIEIPDAPAGEWSYTVTAEEVPYANFPFSLTIGSN